MKFVFSLKLSMTITTHFQEANQILKKLLFSVIHASQTPQQEITYNTDHIGR